MDVVISQPRYLPALTYLQRWAFADRFVLLDTVQRQGRGWENRNRLRVPKVDWLSIPVASSSRALIRDAVIEDVEWIARHQELIRRYYRHHPFFDDDVLTRYFVGAESKVNGAGSYRDVLVHMMRNACNILAIEPDLTLASAVESENARAAAGPDKLRYLCRDVGGTRYVSGPNGREYGVSEAFAGSGIDVVYHVFTHPTYSQPGLDEFVPYLGFLDAVFSAGIQWVIDVVHQPPRLVAG